MQRRTPSWFGERIKEGWICPTERLFIRLGLYRPATVYVLLLLAVLLLLLPRRVGTLGRYTTNLVSLTIGLIMISNLLLGFKRYGDLIYQSAVKFENIGCNYSRNEILMLVFSGTRYKYALTFMLAALILGPLLTLGTPLPIYVVYIVGLPILGYMSGDAVSGTALFSISLKRMLERTSGNSAGCSLLSKNRELHTVVVAGMALLLNGSILVLLALLALPYVVTIKAVPVIVVQVTILAITTPVLLTAFLYPLYGLKKHLEKEKKRVLEGIEAQISQIIRTLSRHLCIDWNLQSSNKCGDAEDPDLDELTVKIRSLEALRTLKEYYENLPVWPLTMPDMIKTALISAIPWLSTLVELEPLIDTVLKILHLG